MAPSKPHQTRLRASCDGCFLAKVKCSKARPICSRCLSCGTECRYSPSSRAGKPKSDINGNHQPNSHQDIQQIHHSLMEDESIAYSAAHQAPSERMLALGTGWHTPPMRVDGNMSRNPSISADLSLIVAEDRAIGDHDHMSAPHEIYSPAMPWTPPIDLSGATFGDSPVITTPLPGAPMRSHSFDIPSMPPMPWTAQVPSDMIPYGQVPTPTSVYFPSPIVTPTTGPAGPRDNSSPTAIGGDFCACFSVCLQSLQALHDASSPSSPPFDLVLSLNQKAVEGCAAMLTCTRCMSRSGTHTAAMLLATVIGKITSFYRNATHTYFETSGMGIPHNPGNNVGVSLGVYQLNGEDGKWVEMEILAREFRKLEEVYARFRDVIYTDLSDIPDVTKAMVSYLGQNLGSTLEVITHRKSDFTCVM
ncbi:hypothetical protein GGS23DRAFT_386705 [Durotheca rogersii]|uniref:uncharacterized protein n=1 Tax=Durotheca rogersii TaxID=419775 RepID=UPI002220BD03|nr:uncharacterized protein GGS23DRAFT_386705 [Durotheca rogersii]KAI5857309.1 hypothetical protein GGS23DRAFT_386705 [Durotheca rogersii]